VDEDLLVLSNTPSMASQSKAIRPAIPDALSGGRSQE
jgi:hypothetical protein